MTAAQRAMATAMIYPVGTPGKKSKTSSATKEVGFSQSRLSMARAVLAHSPPIATAVRRMGELLKQFDGKGNNQHSAEGRAVALPTQKAAGEGAGLSEHQIKQAVRVANVPEEKFEAA